MPVIVPNSVSILPAAQSSGGSLKEKAVAMRYNSHASQDSSLWATAAEAHANAQSQIDNITSYLRKPLPFPDPIQITNPSGVLIAQIGNIVGSDNVAYPGIWAKDLYVGGNGPDTAVIVANDSGVSINGATITLTGGGVETLINNAMNPWSGQGSSLTSINIASGFYSEVDPFHIALLSPSNVPIVYMQVADVAGNGFGSLIVTASTGSSAVSIIGGSGRILATDSVNTVTIDPTNVDSPGFSALGTPGISLTDNVGTSISVSTGSALTSATGPGVAGTTSGTFVTGVTLTVTGHTWTEGLLTA